MALFQPGQSGNPNGRPAIPKDVLDACRAKSMRCVEVLGEALEHEDHRVRLAAAGALLDRAWGKPAQTIDTTVRKEREPIHEAQALLMAREFIESTRLASEGREGSPDPVHDSLPARLSPR